MKFYDKTVLENGATVVTESIPDVRSVAVGFWIGVGSKHEAGSENGISHFIEHMLFKGTSTRTAKKISETFDSLGAEFNAFTTKECTAYYARLLDTHLDTGIEVISDILQNSLFKKDHIDFEREVVLEEIAMYEDTPDELIHDIFTAALWSGHALGQQVLGTVDTVGAFDRDAVIDYCERNYVPKNMVIAAAGNLQHDQVLERVNQFYKPEDIKEAPAALSAPASEGVLKVHHRPTEQAHICYGTAALNSKHADRFVLSVLENILGGSMSSRLFQKIREERGLAYSVYSYHSLYQEGGNLVVYAGTRPANVKEVLNIIKHELDDIKHNGVSDDELIRAREHLKGQMVLGLESTRNRMIRLGKSELTHGEILSVNQLVDRINAIEKDQIQRLAQDVLTEEEMVLTIIGPVEEEMLS